MSAAIPFFSDLPPKAVKAACRLWDTIHRPDYNGVQAYNDFCHDLTIAAIQPPARGVVKRWVAGVQAKLIDRPELLAVEPETRSQRVEGRVYVPVCDRSALPGHKVVPAPVAEDEQQPAYLPTSENAKAECVVYGSDVEVAEAALQNPVPLDSILSALIGAKPIVASPYSPTTKSVTEAAFVGLKVAAGRLLEENIIQLSQSIERTARETTARALRELADELES